MNTGNLNINTILDKDLSSGALQIKIKSISIVLLSVILSLFIISFQFEWVGIFKIFEIRFRILNALSPSDLLLPFLLIVFTVGTLKQGLLSIFETLRWPLWFFAFTAWIGISVLIGYNDVRYCSSWSFINKFLGWFILVFYFYLGNLIQKNDSLGLNKILKTLFVSSSVISLVSILIYIFFRPQYSLPFGVNDNGKFIGFLVNPNAYGLFSVFAVLLQIPFLMRKKLFSILIHWSLILPNIAVILLSGSRAAMIAFVVGIISLVIHNVLSRKRLFIVVLIGIILFSFIDLQKINYYIYTKITQFYTLEPSANERLQSTTQALNWWKEKPLLGIGLGSFLAKQQQQNITPIMTIHNTPIWLLTETGLIGLLLYGWFLFKGRNEVLRKTKEDNDNLLAQGMLIIFPAFIVASVTMEIFYQKYLWFFLGLVLAKPQLLQHYTLPYLSSNRTISSSSK